MAFPSFREIIGRSALGQKAVHEGDAVDSDILKLDAGENRYTPYPALAAQALESRQEPILGLARRPRRQIVVDHRCWKVRIVAE